MEILQNRPLTVLLADDDNDELYLFNEAIEHCGLNIHLDYVNSGNDLFSALGKKLPDLLFLDINMPYKDGLECLVELKQNSDLAGVPIVIYSTTKNNTSINSAYEKGADFFLVKPNNFNDMVKALTQVFTIDWKTYERGSKKDFVLMIDHEQ